ncbi:vacuolar protein sorting-associated protein 13C isoform X3 [Oryzias latipes]|uniref:vacuolar protein sorting-associated protein 13C isoform X3 n=1 Tax=Oryzias latipes TaxID=8090 RepID=UPI000CE1DC62|nr:vacuolar protein sorting-associated protein 13C isoform X3 [Oryzias latipes]
MVFEALVSDTLNRFIGDYVENLDKSQLKIGIWGGNVVLENLKVKENALSEFDIPFKVKAGQIARLTLKIPWKNLYNEAVVASMEGLYLLVVPGATVKYDAAKEERYQQEAKQKELRRIEEVLQVATSRTSNTGDVLFDLESVVYKEPGKVQKGRKKLKKHKKGLKKLKRHESKADTPKAEKKDTFVEKLATQVIKNLQVKISSIHLRYEDDLSDPQRPLSIGLTLSELSLQTTDENWKSCILNEAAKIIYKLGSLECLCAYWNVNSVMFYKESWENIVDKLKRGISTKEQELPHYQYIFRPVFAFAKICINPNAELELSSPKVNLHLEVQNIAFEMTKLQYLNMVELLESFDRMVKNAPYRMFRPDVPVLNNARIWWKYSINSIMEVHIRHLSHMWAWSNILSHRRNLKAYKTVYKNKILAQSKTGPDTERQIQDLEKVLDVFNITLARQQAQMEVIRSGQKLAAKKAAGQKQGGGFFSGWFGKKTKKEDQEFEENVDEESSGLDQLMTPEEKEKLYTAIGYSGSSHNLTLPKQYVAVVVTFQLLRTSLTLREQPDIPEIIKVQMINLSTKVSQRPGAQAFRVEMALEHWFVTGLQQQGDVPSLIASVGDSSSSLLSVVFELNPEESTGDQLLRVHSQPVEIIYDALTVNSMVDFFKTEKFVNLEVLTSATLSKLEEIKEKTAAGLSHIIETRKVLDLMIDLKPSYLLLPKSGFYSATSELVVVDFGSFQLHSVEQRNPPLSSASFSSLEDIMDRAYDRYKVQLRRVQVLYSKSGVAWKTSRLQSSSVQHILQPMDISLQLDKCMVEKDARMPSFKVLGELPLLHVRISDQKILGVMELINSIPFPNMDSSAPQPAAKSKSLVDARPRGLGLDPTFLEAIETDSDGDASERSTDEDHQSSALEELTKVYFKFEVGEVLVELTRQMDQEKAVLSFSVSQLGAAGKMRAFDLSITSYLRRVQLDFCDVPGSPLHLISSSELQGSNLLKVEFTKADPSGPSFQSLFSSTEQMLKVEFSSLDFLLHTKALLATINYLNQVVPPGPRAPRAQAAAEQPGVSGHTSSVSKKVKDGSIFNFKLFAVLGCFHVEVCDDCRSIADIRVQGIDASVFVQAAQTQVFTRLKDIVVTDSDPTSIHRKVVSLVSEEVFSFGLSLFPGAVEGDDYRDMSKVDGRVSMRLGCIQIVYLHKFLMSLLTFVNNFQTAKDALSAATAQAAEKAASSVRDFAQKSFRLSMDIQLKAPLIIIPQSSQSQNAMVVDLGLITVANTFTLLSDEGLPLPAVVEKMDVQLTQLKLCRTTLRTESLQTDIEILQPINVTLLVTRNLSASWFTKIPRVCVQGGLHNLHVQLGEEDLGVLMKILVENIGEGNHAHNLAMSTQGGPEREELPQHLEVMTSQSEAGGAAGNEEPMENTVDVLLEFEIKEVVLTLERLKAPFLVFQLAQLGINTNVCKHDMSATTFINKVSLKCLEFSDSNGGPLCLISSSAESGAELLKVQYCKADRSGPNFSTVFRNTEQSINVTFTSLDVRLHTEALLSSISFLSTALASNTASPSERDIVQKTDDKASSAKSAAVVSPADSRVVNLEVGMTLGAFNIRVCDQTCTMADIKIRGMNGALSRQGAQTNVSARLQDVIVLNADPQSIHQKAVSIVGEEVFSFNLSLTPNATDGAAYIDTSKTDGKIMLNLGCIQVVYLHKFFMSLLNFTNNFQAAKDTLSNATAQAAEKAASSVRDFAQKSFRLSMDIRLKAPLIIIPQSSTSHNALVVDLGLITVANSFSLLPIEGCPLPAVIDNMDVHLGDLKLSRSCVKPDSSAAIELLQPVNLHLNIQRNLSAFWFKKMAAVEVHGNLKPSKMDLSQDDLTMLLRIVTENLEEVAASLPSGSRQDNGQLLLVPKSSLTGEPEKPNDCSEEEEVLETVKFSLSIESLGLTLYTSDPKQPLDQQHQQELRLGELTLHLLRVSGNLQSNGNLQVSTILTSCTLDDLRAGMERVTSRMVRRQEEDGSEPMIDVTYRQATAEKELVVILQKLYLCASVEFLMAVTDFFIQALPQSSSSASSNRQTGKQTTELKVETKTASVARTRVQAVILDPEVVFVASLMKVDTPALVVSFQSDFSLQVEDGNQSVRASLSGLKVLACPFIPNQQDKAVTTVLRPCSVIMETKTHPNGPLLGSVMVEEIIIKISPVILNTVMTITAAMTAKPGVAQGQELKPGVTDLWAARNIYDCDFWFLGVEHATEMTESFRELDASKEGESFTAQVKSIQVTLESGLGHRTVPLLLAESSFSGLARNWSSLLHLKADMTLEVNYFNEVHAVWEPLIERVSGGKRRWNLEMEVKNYAAIDKSPVHGDDFTFVPEPCMLINICSKDTMNITISKSSISVFQKLAKAFSEGTSSTPDFTVKENASFTIRNALGIPLMVQHGTDLRAVGSSVQGKLHELSVDQSMDLEHTRFQMSSRGKLSALQRQESSLFNLTIVPSGYSEISNISLDKPGRRLFNIRGPMLQEAVSVLLQIQAADGNKVMTVRAPLQIKNHFSVPFTILKYCQTSRSLQRIGVVKPEEDFDIPLDAYRCQLFVCPAGPLEGQYNPSTTCVTWKEQVHYSTDVRSLLQCPANSSGVLPLMVSALATPDDLQHIASHGEEDWDPAYVIHLHPVATLRNFLPYTVVYMLENSADSCNLPEGSTSDLLNARLSGELVSLALIRYQGHDWHGHFRIQQEMPEFFDVCLTCESTTNVTVDVSLHVRRTENCLLLSLFSPYWIINKTSRVLQYQAENVTVKHPGDYRDVILFSFRRKKLFTENQVKLCISTSSWSDGFSLDTVGSYGCVRCPSSTMDFLVGVSIQVSSFNLTRIVTMSPYYTLVNKSSYELEVGEVVNASSTKWHYISSTECLPLWPENAQGKLCVRVVGSESSSECFFFHREDRGTLLKLDVCGGIILNVNGSNHSTVISFSDYYEGAAPALLVNHTAWATIAYSQSGSAVVHELKPSEARKFVWDDPTRPRMLRWSYMEHSGELNLLKDEMGQFSYDNKSQIHWISFLDGRQRVLLFTEDTGVVTKARQAEELEQSQQEVRLSLQSLGLSLVNNSSRHEVAYIGINNSGVVWEMKPKNRWKPFSQKNIELLEKAYQLNSTEQGGWTKLETSVEVNLSRAGMMMRKPYSCPIRRTFQPGIYMELKQSLHQRSLRAQLHWLQVDNQLPGAMFPIVFHPVPPPKSLVQDSEPKPFFDVSVITRFNQHSKVMQFKYFMALVQEMAVKLDQGFLGATLALFTPAVDPQAERQKSGLIEADLQGLQAELMEASLSETSGLSFFEYFHISPIKLHLSLSLDSSSNSMDQETAALQSLNLLLKSIGATLTDVDDVIFKLAFFEVKYQFYRREELMKEAARHYGEQFLKQMYVLVLGLDVLGNPFGLIRGLSEGVEAFFYEPFQGAVQGPEEFAEGFAIGVRSLLGHTVGGAAGMVSKITGSMGKGLAAITMDKEFQQKRREEMNRQPKDFSDSLAKGGKGLLKGVVGGVTGIVTKPVEGAKKEGAAGFFKGIGRGLVGIVARPTGGLVDMASSTFQGIQRGPLRAAEATEEVTKLRPPRLIKEDGIIRPYDLTESQGFDLFQRSQITLLDGELFREHCLYPGHSKTNIIVTNRRVLCVKESDFMRQFLKEWEYLFENFYRPPAVTGSELKIYYKEQSKLKLSKKEDQECVKTLHLKDSNVAQKLVAAICDAQVDQLQQRMVRQKSQRFLRASTKR